MGATSVARTRVPRTRDRARGAGQRGAMGELGRVGDRLRGAPGELGTQENRAAVARLAGGRNVPRGAGSRQERARQRREAASAHGAVVAVSVNVPPTSRATAPASPAAPTSEAPETSGSAPAAAPRPPSPPSLPGQRLRCVVFVWQHPVCPKDAESPFRSGDGPRPREMLRAVQRRARGFTKMRVEGRPPREPGAGLTVSLRSHPCRGVRESEPRFAPVPSGAYDWGSQPPPCEMLL